ncbi:hypothetical protein DAPPUDRAFT_265349 [Daphnia pulex]|uniref:ISXO2-like transposase domain-containing protein n=1 Tax=Daphnia pulex TaxID=6669 RepID=E9HTA3_DAPPU|nr:hypothetical protein DAPPUDRAFT_265349 [Daphnia pulex]|eukprot:EFX65021.1 hypothetical protein DAPPUDRAFT_265349 [Daphnia pulex]
MAHATVIDWASFCREVAEDIMIHSSELIGGPGKYNRGKRVDGVWVFGGVERLTVHNRSASTLLAVIKEWIKPGTTIISDCWKAYDNIKSLELGKTKSSSNQ